MQAAWRAVLLYSKKGRYTGMNRSIGRPSRQRQALVVLLLAVVLAVGVSTCWEPILRAIGSALLVSEPVVPADVIVVTLDVGGAGALEAADLVQGGIATRVAVFVDPPRAEDHEFIRRGLPYEDRAARQSRQLRLLGVTEIVAIPRIDAGTEGEAEVLPHWCDENRFRSVVLVTSTDHSRRLRRVLDRAMKGHSTRLVIRPSRYSEFDPDRWWKTRAGIRTGIIVFEKLLLDFVRHPV